MTSKIPTEVSEAIKRLDVSDQVLIQTYIGKLKSTIKDLEAQLNTDDAHAHYHGGERCTGIHDHGHDHHTDDSGAECCEGHSHEHGHGHSHEHSHDDTPAWKKEAMNADPHACPFGGTWGKEASIHATKQQEENFPPMYSDGSNDDFDKAADAKMAASDLKSQGLYKESLEKFTEAVLAAEPSALLMANRAHVLFKLKKYAAAIRDCDYALEKNPDSAKALRIRGECNLKVEKYHAALKDLSAAQTIDFDEEAAIMLKEATEKCRELDAVEVKKKVEEEEKLKKRAAEIKKAQEDAKREAEEEARQRSASSGGMPGMGGMGGMPGGMAGMQGLMNDPEIAAGMQNPKIQKAFTDLMSGPGGPMGLMSNPAKLQELMTDPEVGPFLQKIMGKVMGAGAGGGMGMPGMGGAAGGGFGGGDMPDLDNDEDDDEMPDLVD